MIWILDLFFVDDRRIILHSIDSQVFPIYWPCFFWVGSPIYLDKDSKIRLPPTSTLPPICRSRSGEDKFPSTTSCMAVSCPSFFPPVWESFLLANPYREHSVYNTPHPGFRWFTVKTQNNPKAPGSVKGNHIPLMQCFFKDENGVLQNLTLDLDYGWFFLFNVKDLNPSEPWKVSSYFKQRSP